MRVCQVAIFPRPVEVVPLVGLSQLRCWVSLVGRSRRSTNLPDEERSLGYPAWHSWLMVPMVPWATEIVQIGWWCLTVRVSGGIEMMWCRTCRTNRCFSISCKLQMLAHVFLHAISYSLFCFFPLMDAPGPPHLWYFAIPSPFIPMARGGHQMLYCHPFQWAAHTNPRRVAAYCAQ